jgi:6-methylsalicylate decarboxylase
MPGNRIDVHAHYLGGAIKRLFESGFTLRGGYKIPGHWTPQHALEFMDRHEIAAQILSAPWSMNDARIGAPGGAARFCRDVNTELAQLVSDHPQRFGAFAALPAENVDEALTEVDYALDVLGLDGILLTSNACGHYLGESFMDSILEELARRDHVPVFVHPVDCPHIDELGFGRPSSVIEYPFDTARTITNAIYRGTFQRHPDLTLIVAHCGGALPTLGWRIAEHTEMGRGPDDADIDPAHVREVLRRLYYDTALAGSAHSLLPTLEVTDVNHLLFGSDWPAAPERVVEHNTANLTAFPAFSAKDFAKVNRDNAIALFPRFT